MIFCHFVFPFPESFRSHKDTIVINEATATPVDDMDVTFTQAITDSDQSHNVEGTVS